MEETLRSTVREPRERFKEDRKLINHLRRGYSSRMSASHTLQLTEERVVGWLSASPIQTAVSDEMRIVCDATDSRSNWFMNIYSDTEALWRKKAKKRLARRAPA